MTKRTVRIVFRDADAPAEITREFLSLPVVADLIYWDRRWWKIEVIGWDFMSGTARRNVYVRRMWDAMPV